IRSLASEVCIISCVVVATSCRRQMLTSELANETIKIKANPTASLLPIFMSRSMFITLFWYLTAVRLSSHQATGLSVRLLRRNQPTCRPDAASEGHREHGREKQDRKSVVVGK